MICTECSKHIRPVVATDIDGTLGDYHETFKLFCQRYFQWNVPPEPWDGNGELEDFLGLTKVEYREAKLAYRQGGNKRWMPIYPGAAQFCRDVRAAGAELWVATSRPWQRLDNIDPDTRFWLDYRGIEVDGLLYGEDKYERLCQSVDKERIVAVVDDLPEQAEIATRLDLPFIMREQPHNDGAFRWHLAGDLYMIRDIVIERIGVWFDAHR